MVEESSEKVDAADRHYINVSKNPVISGEEAGYTTDDVMTASYGSSSCVSYCSLRIPIVCTRDNQI